MNAKIYSKIRRIRVSLNLNKAFKTEMNAFVNKNVIIFTKEGDKIQGLLIGMSDTDLSVIIGNALVNGDKNHRTFVSGSVITKMTLGETPFDIAGLRMELEKVFKKSGVRYFPESRTIQVMDRYRVTETSVEGDEGPIADRIKRIWVNFKAEQEDLANKE
jgi:small nuclear ribonucleoprotein (snRNP)-like protein